MGVGWGVRLRAGSQATVAAMSYAWCGRWLYIVAHVKSMTPIGTTVDVGLESN